MEEHNSTGRRTAVGDEPTVLFAVDRGGTFTLSEGTGLEALGLEAGAMVGRSAFEACTEAPSVAENVRRALSGGAFTSDGRYYVLRAGKVSVEQGAPPPDAVDRIEGLTNAAMVEERQNGVLDALEKKLLAGAKVDIHHDVLYRIVVPSSP